MRRALSVFPLSFCLLSLAAPALAAPSADLPLVGCGHLTCIDASDPAGRPLRLVIDTGNEDSVLSRQAADRLGLATSPARGPDGKEIHGYSVTGPIALDLGGVKLAPAALAVADLAQYQQAVGAPIDGTLSYGQLKGWIADFDFKAGRLHLTQDAVAKPRSILKAHYVKYRGDATTVLVVDGFAVHGYPIRAQLDTAFEGALLLFPATLPSIGLGDPRTGEHASLPDYDSGETLDRIEPATVAFDRTKLLVPSNGAFVASAEVRAPENDIQAVAGRELFSGHRLVLDFIHDQVGVD
jgi:hypothetical protein